MIKRHSVFIGASAATLAYACAILLSNTLIASVGANNVAPTTTTTTTVVPTTTTAVLFDAPVVDIRKPPVLVIEDVAEAPIAIPVGVPPRFMG